jgi:hypothetical protein
MGGLLRLLVLTIAIWLIISSVRRLFLYFLPLPHRLSHSGHGICLGRALAQSPEAGGGTNRVGVFGKTKDGQQ